MKDLFISFRTANQTYSVLRRSVFSLMHRAEAALFSILILCKLATNLLFVSLMQQVWSLTLPPEKTKHPAEPAGKTLQI